MNKLRWLITLSAICALFQFGDAAKADSPHRSILISVDQPSMYYMKDDPLREGFFQILLTDKEGHRVGGGKYDAVKGSTCFIDENTRISNDNGDWVCGWKVEEIPSSSVYLGDYVGSIKLLDLPPGTYDVSISASKTKVSWANVDFEHYSLNNSGNLIGSSDHLRVNMQNKTQHLTLTVGSDLQAHLAESTSSPINVKAMPAQGSISSNTLAATTTSPSTSRAVPQIDMQTAPTSLKNLPPEHGGFLQKVQMLWMNIFSRIKSIF